MSELSWFIPGRPGPPGGPVARYRPPQPVRAVGAYVQRLTQPGDLVVDLFCQGPTAVREIVAAGRRALGLSANPVLLVAARLGLGRCDAHALNAAFTRLADSPKGDLPLRRHLALLYRSACPACGAPGEALWFAWDRDGDYPFKKAVRCARCEAVQEGAADDEDVRAARRIQPRGLAYYYALDRVAPPGHPARERAAELVRLYTPRNLSALMDLSLRLEGLEAGEEVWLALAGVLLDCFDAGSSLDPYGEERPRPRTLRLPSRYLERNVWLCFEEGLLRCLDQERGLAPVPQAGDVAALLGGRRAAYALASRTAREVGEVVPPGSAALVLADPPRPDAVFWALSALWAGWLEESPAARALRPFLRRRRFDWEWHWRVLRTALGAAGPLLTAAGHLVTLFSEPDAALLASACMAASGAGYALAGWGYGPASGYRLVWRWAPGDAGGAPPAGAQGVEALAGDLEAAAGEAAVGALRARGEPAPWALLHAGAYARLSEQGLLARAAAAEAEEAAILAFACAADAVHRALEAVPVVRPADQGAGGGALKWLAGAGQAPALAVGPVEPPLADRVEALAWDLLAGPRPAWDPEELVEAVYARLSGPLTPELALVLACIESYSVREGGALRLRPEDDPHRRAAELRELRRDLAGLGRRLGFRVRRGGGWDVRWLEEGGEAYVFAVSATAALGPRLLAAPAPPGEVAVGRAAGEGVQRCLVLPGGRAQLVSLKLQRDPRLARAVAEGGWQFIKFRHLRRLVGKEELDRHALKTVLGLDPIAEQEAAQIPLF